MNNVFKKAMALLISALFVCMFMVPQQALAVAGSSGHPAAQYDTDTADATPDATAQPDDGLVSAAQLPGVDDKSKLSAAESKLDSQLLQLARPDLTPKNLVSNGLTAVLNPAELSGKQSAGSLDTVKVYVKMQPGAGFGALGSVSDVEDTDGGNGLAVVNVSTDKLEALAGIDAVDSVKIVHPPIVNTGSITSQGDTVINADKLRTATGKNGAGVKIGVISDGADNYKNAVATHDLPDVGDPGSVTVLSNKIGGDEGTAMMEIVHDVAPGANLYFHDCGSNMIEFNEAIDDLVAHGCTVICDDINWLDDYFFADGIISTHIAQLLQNDKIIYVTSAGNQADVHYQGLCKSGIGQASDFRASNTSTQKDLYIDLPPGSAFDAVLQWDDPIGQSTNDYDLYASPVNHGASYMDLISCYASSKEAQTGSQDPYESLELINNTSNTERVALWVYNFDAHTQKTLEIYVFGYGAEVEPINEVSADSIFGHAAVPGVLACAAIDGNPSEHHSGMSTGTIEYYSSRGPVTMADGSKRQKPDITGVDGVSVTGAGGFENPFYGTSAASPHVAAVAALLWSVYPSLKASEIRQMITSGAADMGPAGFDYTYGYGRIDALGAAMFTVKFDCQGGPAVQSAQLLRNTKLTAPTQPVRTGYTFGGWYQEAACVNPWDFDNTAVPANMTLFAKWTINAYAVTFDSQGGGAVTGKTAVYNSTIPAPALPTRAGYAFGGWYKDAGFSSVWNFATDKVTDNITLYAKWNAQACTVSFDSQGGGTVPPVTAPFGAKITAPADPSLTGYNFGGWYKDAACTDAWDFAAGTVDGNITLYAKWTAVSCKVTFDAQGGSDGPDPVSADYGTAIAFPAVPALDGFYFGGWYTGTDFTRQWSFTHDKVTGDMTLYAHWVLTPPALVISAASSSYNSVSVSWNPIPYATGYIVSEAASANGPWNLLNADSDSTGVEYNTLATNTKYYFKVQAQCMKDGNPYSCDSSVVSAAPLPAAPASVSSWRASYNSITVSWSAVAGATRYEVWRSTSASGGYKRIITTASLHYTNKGLTTGTAYYYKVKAYKTVKGKKVYGGFSAATSARPLLSVPAVYASRAGATSIKVSWARVSGATKYEIWRASADTGIFSLLATTTRTYYTNTGLRTGQPYYYRVRAYRSTGKSYSGYSSVAVATP